jgi:crotonobetainyl-CoA:carnitine CoA-transferase CaiB-like acyl-CoA transferase
MIGISNERLFRRLCAALGREDWLEDPRFRTNLDRVRNRAHLEGPIADLLRDRSTADWLQLFGEHDVPADAVQNSQNVLEDSQLEALDQLAEVALRGEASAQVPRLPISLSVTPPAVSGPPPELGQHGRAILQEAGYSDAEIDELVRSRSCAIGA